MSKPQPTPPRTGAAEFAATRWTLVLAAAGRGASPVRGTDPGRRSPAKRLEDGAANSLRASEAMAELCGSYWYPLYAFIRRRGHGAQEAEDLTQEFFARLLAKRFLAGVDRRKGRFRTFLLMAVKRFLANEYDRCRARKRGGGRRLVSLEGLEPETRYCREPAHRLSAERLFEQQWALTLLDNVLARLQAEMTGGGKAELFDALKGHLALGGGGSYAAAAAGLGMTEGAVKTAVHRLRRRYRDLLREEIAHTVADPAEIEDEIRHLFECL
jgi:RNA polymerase sigma-70 factor (ECF subfamily)